MRPQHAVRDRPHADAVVAGSIRIERAHQVLGPAEADGDGRLHRRGLVAADPQRADVDERGRRVAVHELALVDHVQLCAVELRAVDRELVGRDVDVLTVDAEQRLVAEAGAAVSAGIGGVDLEARPGAARVGGMPDRDLEPAGRERVVQEEDAREPGVRGRVVLAARIAGELLEAVAEEGVDVRRPGEAAAVLAVHPEGGVHRLEDEPVADAEPLVGGLELGAEVRDGAVKAADAVEVANEPGRRAASKAVAAGATSGTAAPLRSGWVGRAPRSGAAVPLCRGATGDHQRPHRHVDRKQHSERYALFPDQPWSSPVNRCSRNMATPSTSARRGVPVIAPAGSARRVDDRRCRARRGPQAAGRSAAPRGRGWRS